jgi:hypothetical protein
VRFPEALTKVGVKNQLLIIHEKGHGDFDSAENLRVWTTIQDFLASVEITTIPAVRTVIWDSLPFFGSRQEIPSRSERRDLFRPGFDKPGMTRAFPSDLQRR